MGPYFLCLFLPATNACTKLLLAAKGLFPPFLPLPPISVPVLPLLLPLVDTGGRVAVLAVTRVLLPPLLVADSPNLLFEVFVFAGVAIAGIGVPLVGLTLRDEDEGDVELGSKVADAAEGDTN